MLNAILATKEYMTTIFDEESKKAMPCTALKFTSAVVSGVKTKEIDGYTAVVLGFGKKKNFSKSENGKFSKLGYVPMFVKEIRVDSVEGFKVGQVLNPEEMFETGERLKVQGVSKGKGFQGVMKRWNFKGGPRTHGQSDRMRAPGSIGMRSTPGRVFKGKKMPGRMGGDVVSVKSDLIKVDAENGLILLKGSVPGGRNSLILIEKSNR